MADNELLIHLIANDEASPVIRKAMGETGVAVNRLKDQTKTSTDSIQTQFKEAGKAVHDFRKTMFLATAAVAIVISSVREASNYNQQAKVTFDQFTKTIASLSTTIGMLLSPALEGITMIVGILRDTLESAIAGLLKVAGFIDGFFSNLSRGPVQAYKMAMMEANFAADDFLKKMEETRAQVESGQTFKAQEQQAINLEKITVKSNANIKASYGAMLQGVSGALGALSGALTVAASENKKFAVAAQIAALGMAIVNTALGITNALATPPPWLGLAMAAIIGAAGAIQIATIASQGFAQGTDTVPSMLSPGEMVIPRTFASAIRSGELSLAGKGGGAGNVFNISVNNPTISSRDSISDLAEMLGFEIERKLRGARVSI